MPSVTRLPSAPAATLPHADGTGVYRPLRCVGPAIMPTPLAADLARLLDVDGDVERWSCRPVAPCGHGAAGVVFEVRRGTVTERLRPCENAAVLPDGRQDDPDDIPVRAVTRDGIDPVRLENARLILPHARWRVSLDDRVRLLAALEEEGSVTLGECLSIFRNTSRPIAAVASLALSRVVDLDLDIPLGSRSRVIRRTD